MSEPDPAEAGFRVSFPGPFTQHEVVVDGWSVPLVSAQPCGDHDESVMLILDHRLAATFSVEEAERFVAPRRVPVHDHGGDAVADLTSERQRLRDQGVNGSRLERNRVKLARTQWALSHALIERFL